MGWKNYKRGRCRAEYNVNIIAIVSGEDINVMPAVNYVLKDTDHIKIISSKQDLNNLVKHM